MKKKKIQCETCQGKAFCNWAANRIHFTFPNGNHMSTVWGAGTYSDNYDADLTVDRTTFLTSNTVEVVFDSDEKTKKKIFRKLQQDGQPLMRLTMQEFAWLFTTLSIQQ